MANTDGGVGFPVPPDDGVLVALASLRSEWDKALIKVSLDKFDGSDTKYDDMEFKLLSWLERMPNDIPSWMVGAGEQTEMVV